MSTMRERFEDALTSMSSFSKSMIGELAGHMVEECESELSRAQQPVEPGPWYLGSLNDGLFIINTPPRPSTDEVWHDRPDGPTLVLNVVALEQEQSQAIVDVHNAEVSRLRAELARLTQQNAELREVVSRLQAQPSPQAQPAETVVADMDLRCGNCQKTVPCRYVPSPDAGPYWRCSECGGIVQPPETATRMVCPECHGSRAIAVHRIGDGPTGHEEPCPNPECDGGWITATKEPT